MKNAHGTGTHGESGSTLTRALSDAQTLHVIEKRIAERDARDVSAIVDALASDDETAVYRVYTEDLPIVRIVSRYFAGYSLYHGSGVWNHQVEASVTIEIVATLAERPNVERMAQEIAYRNRQTMVLVTVQSSRGLARVDVAGETVQAADGLAEYLS